MNKHLKKVVLTGIMSALAIVLIAIFRFPIIPAAPYLIYEPGDMPILIVSFLLGPLYGLCMTIVVSILQMIVFNASDGWVGCLMHIIATGAFSVTAGLIYRKVHSFKGAIIALVSGTLVMTAIMVPANLYFTVNFYKVPFDVVLIGLPTTTIPFNFIKAGINSVLTIIIYKSISKVIHKFGWL